MENLKQRHNRKMPDRRKNLKASACIVTSSVTGKQNASREPVMRRIERFEPEKSNRSKMTTLSTIES